MGYKALFMPIGDLGQAKQVIFRSRLPSFILRAKSSEHVLQVLEIQIAMQPVSPPKRLTPEKGKDAIAVTLVVRKLP